MLCSKVIPLLLLLHHHHHLLHHHYHHHHHLHHLLHQQLHQHHHLHHHHHNNNNNNNNNNKINRTDIKLINKTNKRLTYWCSLEKHKHKDLGYSVREDKKILPLLFYKTLREKDNHRFINVDKYNIVQCIICILSTINEHAYFSRIVYPVLTVPVQLLDNGFDDVI